MHQTACIEEKNLKIKVNLEKFKMADLALIPFSVELSGTGKQSFLQPPLLLWQGWLEVIN